MFNYYFFFELLQDIFFVNIMYYDIRIHVNISFHKREKRHLTWEKVVRTHTYFNENT